MPIGRPRWFFQIDGGFFVVVDGGFFSTWAARLHFGKSPKILVKFCENSAKFWQNSRNFGKKTAKNSAIFNENFEIREWCKAQFSHMDSKSGAKEHSVDLGESFPTSIFFSNR